MTETKEIIFDITKLKIIDISNIPDRIFKNRKILKHIYYLNNKEKIIKKQEKYRLTHRKLNKEYNYNYYLINREKRLNYSRNHYLCSTKLDNDKKYIFCNKRPYPLNNACELCGRINKKLNYHHWNNEHLEFGLWVCVKPCHWLIESIDCLEFENLKNKYLKFKEIIEKMPFNPKCYIAGQSS